MKFFRCCFSEICISDSHYKFMKVRYTCAESWCILETNGAYGINKIDTTRTIHDFIAGIFMN